MPTSPKRSVLLVDFENIVRPPDNILVAKLSNWVMWLEAGEFDPARRRRKLLSKRVYWNSHCEGNRPIFERQGFDAFACPAAVKDKKSAADIWIALDAIDVLDEFRGLEEIILLSTDTDFVPVVNRLREKKKDVVVLVNEHNLSADVYSLHADAVIPLSDLRRATSYQKPKRGWFDWVKKASPPPDPAPVAPLAPAPAPIAQETRAPPQRASPPPRSTGAPPSFDIAGAADLVAKAASAQRGLFISRETVRNVLRGVPGFATTGKYPWLNCGNYCGMLERIAKLKPELEYTKYERGCAIRARKT